MCAYRTCTVGLNSTAYSKCTVIVMSTVTRRIELPSDMLDELDRWATELGMGYATSAEAVKDAIRRRIEQLRTARVNRQHLEEEEIT